MDKVRDERVLEAGFFLLFAAVPWKLMMVHAQATVQFLASHRPEATVPTSTSFLDLKIEDIEPQ